MCLVWVILHVLSAEQDTRWTFFRQRSMGGAQDLQSGERAAAATPVHEDGAGASCTCIAALCVQILTAGVQGSGAGLRQT